MLVQALAGALLAATSLTLPAGDGKSVPASWHAAPDASEVARVPVIVLIADAGKSRDDWKKVAKELNAAGLSVLAIDARARKPRIGAGFGGLSGPAIKPIALRLVHEASKAVKIPVIGLGGIATGEDAAEFLIAGASAVEVGTATFWDPEAPARIARELDRFCEEEKVARAADLTATLQF